MKYITSLHSNIRKGIDLDNATSKILSVGPNGIGKSIVADTATLACLGAIYAGGKELGAEIDLHKHKKQGDEGALTASATIGDAETNEVWQASWSSEGSTASAKRAKHFRPDWLTEKCFPLINIQELMQGGQDGLRAAFMQVVAQGVSIDDVTALLTEESYKEYKEEKPSDVTAFDCLESLAGRCVSEKKNAATAVKRFDAELSSAGSVGSPPSEASVKSAEDALEAVERSRDVCSRNVGAIDQEIRSATQVKTQAVATAHLPKTGMWSVANELKAVLEAAVKVEPASCPVCGQKCDTEFYGKRRDVIESKLKMASQMPVASVPVQAAVAPEHLLRKRADALALLEASRKACDSARDTLISLREARVAFENAASARKVKAKAATDVDKWGRIAKDVRSALDSLLERGIANVESKVQKYLPARYMFGVRLTAGDRRICHIGFRRSVSPANTDTDAFDTAISDGERAILLVALALALSEDVEFKVIIPPDCSMDAETLSLFLEATATAPAQLLVSSTTKPNRVPAGWKMIELNTSQEGEAI